MKLALERSEKDTIHPLDNGEKILLSAYSGLDAAKCSNEDHRFLNDKMLQLVVVQSKEHSSCDRVPETQSLCSLSPSVDDGVEVPPSTACLGSFVLVGTATCSTFAVQREGEDGSPIVPSSFSIVGGGSSILSDPHVLHLRISWNKHTPKEIWVKSDGKFCWFTRLGVQDGALKLINE